MLAFIVNNREMKELEYLIKREMDEILHDLNDSRIDHIVKDAMEDRYQVLFNLLKRFASQSEYSKYVRAKKYKCQKKIK
ncbi:hypothetical protein [Calidifontibacillus erzurumensis]|uniref:Uncharacterized protein n=1 Tax=Calidifontibacillus erzurumensis TaxID=2741433 RepID=A0A8J8KF58_9BACI|nr:hypothetical protein [Calidifontibacillus erzurumensis]NSL52540.1 hypothetical protein [Calidifontibacillus erzurumensis]